MLIQHSVKIWFAVQHSVKSAVSLLGDIDIDIENNEQAALNITIP